MVFTVRKLSKRVLCILAFIVLPRAATAQSVTLAWDTPTDQTIAGYIVSYGTASGRYTGSVDAGLQTQASVTNLTIGQQYFFTVRAYNAERMMSDPAAEVSAIVTSDYVQFSDDFRAAAPSGAERAVQFDYDGDGRAELPVFRAATGQWHMLSGATRTPFARMSFGQNGDIPLSGDVDGDRKADLVVYRPSTGRWYILGSANRYGVIQTYAWGFATDVPLTADFDGDRRADLVVYRPSTGMWYVLQSSAAYTQWMTYKWGIDLTALPGDYQGDGSADRPVPADYDGDGRADFAVYRPSTGAWYVLPSSTGYTGGWSVKWGIDTTALPADYTGDGSPDVPVPADYDGDGSAELTVFRSSTGMWYSLLSSTGFSGWATLKWGMAGDTPVPADYDGDGLTDAAVFRPSSANWFVNQQPSSTWGLSTDTPLPRR